MELTAKSELLVSGQMVGGCRILRLLGRGGMGEVHLAEHLLLQRMVAVKVLRSELGGEEHSERFLQEARMCSRVEHPNVVIVHDVGQYKKMYYIVMQYIPGRNLTQLVQEQHGHGPLPWRSSLRVIQLAAKGLHAVHCHNLVHRDIKPSNIMLSDDSRVFLMDFGLVREESRDLQLTRVGEVVGTAPFMSPEQCRNESLDRRSDIYSLGSTLYYMLTAQLPFQGNPSDVMHQIGRGDRPSPIVQFNPTVPPEVCEVVARAMAFRSEDRFPHAEAMSAELKRLVRAALVANTSSWRNTELSTVNESVGVASELLPVELLPLETKWEAWATRLPSIGAAVGLVVCLALLALVVHVFGRAGKTAPSSPTSRSGMVSIEAGFVQLGNDRVKLRRFLEARISAAKIDGALNILDQEPQQRAEVPAFWIDQYEVTNAEYGRFVQATGHRPPLHWEGNQPPLDKVDHPVVNITYDDADAYAHWAGKLLPTREQWMRAFRGDHDWLFPWGDDYDADRANVGDNPKFPSLTIPVKATPRDVSHFGVCNLVGNVCEFIRGSFHFKNLDWRFSKGAEYKSPGFMWGIGSCQFLYGPNIMDASLGFRCVIEKPSASGPQ